MRARLTAALVPFSTGVAGLERAHSIGQKRRSLVSFYFMSVRASFSSLRFISGIGQKSSFISARVVLRPLTIGETVDEVLGRESNCLATADLHSKKTHTAIRNRISASWSSLPVRRQCSLSRVSCAFCGGTNLREVFGAACNNSRCKKSATDSIEQHFQGIIRELFGLGC